MWPWVQAVGTVSTACPRREKKWLDSDLGRLVEPRDGLLAGSVLPDSGAQFRLFEQVVAVVGEVARAAARWFWSSTTCTGPTPPRCSCSATWRPGCRAGTVVIGALRDRAPAPGTELARMLAAASRLPGHRRIRLGPLGLAEVAELVRRETGHEPRPPTPPAASMPAPPAIRSSSGSCPGSSPTAVVLDGGRCSTAGCRPPSATSSAIGWPTSTTRCRSLLPTAALIGRDVSSACSPHVADLDVQTASTGSSRWRRSACSSPRPRTRSRSASRTTWSASRSPRHPAAASDSSCTCASPTRWNAPTRTTIPSPSASPTTCGPPARSPTRPAPRRAGARRPPRGDEVGARGRRAASAFGRADFARSRSGRAGAVRPVAVDRGGRDAVDVRHRSARPAGARRTPGPRPRPRTGGRPTSSSPAGPLTTRASSSTAAARWRAGCSSRARRPSDPIDARVRPAGLGNSPVGHRQHRRGVPLPEPVRADPARRTSPGARRIRSGSDLQLLMTGMLAEMTALHGDVDAARALLDTLEAAAGDNPYRITVWATFVVEDCLARRRPGVGAARGRAGNRRRPGLLVRLPRHLPAAGPVLGAGRDRRGPGRRRGAGSGNHRREPPRPAALVRGHLVRAARRDAPGGRFDDDAAAALDRADFYLETYGQRYPEGLLLLLRARLLQARGEPVARVRAAAERRAGIVSRARGPPVRPPRRRISGTGSAQTKSTDDPLVVKTILIRSVESNVTAVIAWRRNHADASRTYPPLQRTTAKSTRSTCPTSAPDQILAQGRCDGHVPQRLSALGRLLPAGPSHRPAVHTWT